MLREPRSMTAADMMALAAGVGLGIVLRPALPRGVFHPVLISSSWATVGAVAISVVVLARLIRYGRRARPAEWLAILAAIYQVTDRPEWQVDRAIEQVLGFGLGSALGGDPPALGGDVSFSGPRWAVAGLTALMVAGGLVLLRVGRAGFHPWFKTLATAWLAFVALWGAIGVIGIDGPNLLAPSSGFGAGIGAATYWMACQHLAMIPLGLLFGVPLIAAIDARVRRFPWAWTEWAGSGTFLVALMLAAALRRGQIDGISTLSAIEKGLDIAWFLGVGLLSRWILIRLRPAWSAWFDAPPTRQRSEVSTEASPARTA